MTTSKPKGNLRLLPSAVERGQYPKVAIVKSEPTCLGTFFALFDGTAILRSAHGDLAIGAQEMRTLLDELETVAYEVRRRGEILAGLDKYKCRLVDGVLRVKHGHHVEVMFVPRRVAKRALVCASCRRWIQIGETRYVEKTEQKGDYRQLSGEPNLCEACATPPAIGVREVTS